MKEEYSSMGEKKIRRKEEEEEEKSKERTGREERDLKIWRKRKTNRSEWGKWKGREAEGKEGRKGDDIYEKIGRGEIGRRGDTENDMIGKKVRSRIGKDVKQSERGGEGKF